MKGIKTDGEEWDRELIFDHTLNNTTLLPFNYILSFYWADNLPLNELCVRMIFFRFWLSELIRQHPLTTFSTVYLPFTKGLF